MKRLGLLLVLAVAAMCVAPVPAAPNAPPLPAAPFAKAAACRPPTTFEDPHYQAKQPNLPPLTMEHLQGAMAHAFVATKRKLDRKFAAIHDRNAALMAERGFHPAGTVTVYRYTRRAQPISLVQRLIEVAIPKLHAESYYPGEGEFIITDYLDGDNNTWEGNFFAHHYQHGIYASENTQWYVASTAEQFAEPILAEWDESIAPSANVDATFHGTRCLENNYIVKHIIVHAAQRAGWRCAGAAVFCNAAGWPSSPGYWICMSGSCGGQFGAYVLEEFNDWQRICVCKYEGGQFCE